MNIAIACDHGGFQLKKSIIHFCKEQGIEYVDFGCDSETSVDYPIYAKKVADAVTTGICQMGILLCGTGIGMSIAANKCSGIRAALCHDTFSARMTRMHNDANILCMGGRVIGVGPALEIVSAFLHTDFMGERHARRVQMIAELER